jgi:ubiquitin-conjugating enzyme E2 I
MSSGAKAVAVDRLKQERKMYKKEKGFGFFGRPVKREDGTSNLFHWKCGIPGKEGTPWEGGTYTVEITFPEDFPTMPPRCKFNPVLFHPNVYPSGTVCLSILDENKGWKPCITVKQILEGIQELLDTPNLLDPAQEEPYYLCKNDPAAYERKIREIAKANAL